MTNQLAKTNIFIRHTSEYKREYKLLQNYIEQASFYLSVTRKQPLDKCREFIIQLLKSGKTNFRVPKIKALIRGKNGDRTDEVMSLEQYLNHVTENGYLMSPTMAVYKTPKQHLSLFAELMEANIERRSKAKEEKFDAEMEGNKTLAEIKDVQQTTLKIKNNSLSGAHGSAFTPLYNKSAHSTLTATCRSMTTTNNAHSERFLSGNRHYFTPSVTVNNIISITQATDIPRVRKVMDHYGIVPPTPEQVYAGVKRSTDLYWRSDEVGKLIMDILVSLTPEQLAAFHFNGDMYQLRETNPEFVRQMLNELSEQHDDGDYPEVNLTKMNEEDVVLLSSIFIDEVRGFKIKKIIETKPDLARRMRCTFAGMYRTIEKYKDLILTFFCTDHPPASIGDFTHSLRRVVPVSDTDSTVYVVQGWIKDRFGEVKFDREARAYGAAVGYLNNKLTGHWLAMLSAHMGIAHERQEQLVMKNEFSFPVIFMTGKAKHYAMLIDGCEGNFYKDDDLELKGVSFRNSKVPAVIRDRTKALIIDVMNKVRDGITIDGNEILTSVANTEREIIASLENGNISFLPTAQVRERSSYQNPESSPWRFKPMFDEVFGPVYGKAPEPPYQCVKVNVEWNNKTQFNEWLDSIDDKALGERMRQYVLRSGGRYPTNLLVPYDIARTGLPKEIVQAIDKRKLVTGLMESAYLALESLGMYKGTPKNTVLISDNY